jgi:hypothetical protein
MTYTVIVYKADKRKKTGEREVLYKDYETDNLSMLEHTVKHTWRTSAGFRYEIHVTMVEKTNMMGGGKFMERFDTPYYCSPASESYWSM